MDLQQRISQVDFTLKPCGLIPVIISGLKSKVQCYIYVVYTAMSPPSRGILRTRYDPPLRPYCVGE